MSRGTAGTGERAAYHEFPAPGPLAPYVVCMWTQTAPAGGVPYLHRVLPDACVDIVCIGAEPPVAVGPATLPQIVALPAGTPVVGIRFRPGMAPAWLGTGAWELLNATVALRELWGRPAAELAERVARAGPAQARLKALQVALAGRLGSCVRPGDPLVAGAVPWLAAEGSLRADDLSRRLGLSGRQTLRRFRDWVGYGPKTLQRILRLQRLLLLAEDAGPGVPDRPEGSGSPRGLTALALAAGYADHPHMSREVGELAGLTPGALLARPAATLRMSDLFKTAPRASR